MVDLLTLILPNFNLAALLGLLIAILGGLVLYAGLKLSLLGRLGELIQGTGVLMIVGGILYWFGISFFQDLLADEKARVIVIAAVAVIAVAVALFWEPKKMKKRGKRR